jgi:hypothetical protein
MTKPNDTPSPAPEPQHGPECPCDPCRELSAAIASVSLKAENFAVEIRCSVCGDLLVPENSDDTVIHFRPCPNHNAPSPAPENVGEPSKLNGEEFFDAMKHGNGLLSEVFHEMEDVEQVPEETLEKMRGAIHHYLGCTVWIETDLLGREPFAANPTPKEDCCAECATEGCDGTVKYSVCHAATPPVAGNPVGKPLTDDEVRAVLAAERAEIRIQDSDPPSAGGAAPPKYQGETLIDSALYALSATGVQPSAEPEQGSPKLYTQQEVNTLLASAAFLWKKQTDELAAATREALEAENVRLREAANNLATAASKTYGYDTGPLHGGSRDGYYWYGRSNKVWTDVQKAVGDMQAALTQQKQR